MHTLMQRAGIPGPYILVGHSLGGAVVQVYASLYPQEVAGMVLADPRTRGIESKWPAEYVRSLEMNDQANPVLAFPGVFRLINWLGMYKTQPSFELLPLEQRELAYRLDYNSRLFAHQAAISHNDEDREALFDTAGPLPDVPLIVIGHTIADQLPGVNTNEDVIQQADRIWLEEMKKLALESPQGVFMYADKSGHNIILEQPETVITAIWSFVKRVGGK